MVKIILLILLPFLIFGNNSLSGKWDGKILIGPQFKLNISIHFSQKNNVNSATIDIPQQGAKGLPLQDISVEGNKISFSLNAGPNMAYFNGIKEGEVISGQFKQATTVGTFSIKKEQKQVSTFYNEELAIPNNSITLYGTLSYPKNANNLPLVILISGSGKQDRSQDILGFKTFDVLAEELNQQNVAVFRYDERGAGKSTGDFKIATSKHFADDAQAILIFLKKKYGTLFKQYGFLGHSEGANVAAMVAARSNKSDFIILMAGSAVPGTEILLKQSTTLLKARNADVKTIEAQTALQNKIFKTVRSNAGWDTLEKDIERIINSELEKLPTAEKNSLPPDYLEKQVQSQINAVKSPWYATFIDHNPAHDLKKISIPVLALYGGKDLQVPMEQNRPAAEKALMHNPFYKGIVFNEANHIFQKANSGAVSEYATLEPKFVEGFTKTIAEWVKELSK